MKLVDPYNREINYLRLSVTDRCDFRCQYCMASDMKFLPRPEILSLEELLSVASAFANLGLKKLRLTGGEPLVRSGVETLIEGIGRLGLEEFALTTNGSRLKEFAPLLKDAGVTAINISLDSLDPGRFREITRTGDLGKTLEGIEAARSAGFRRIRLNSVILRGINEDEILGLVDYAVQTGVNITFIEEMPLGMIDSHKRQLSFVSSQEIREVVQEKYKVGEQEQHSAWPGPSRDFAVSSSGSEPVTVGFISPHTNNFCHLCNRVRLTVEGRLLLCLGHEHSVDFKPLLRENPGNLRVLEEAIIDALALKPEKHEFNLEEEPQIVRFMNQTGG